MPDVKPWTPSRMWKGKSCEVWVMGDDKVSLRLADSGAFDFTIYDPIHVAVDELDGIGVHTDPRFGSHVERRYMHEGVMSGLEERRDHLPGRFPICKAIGLAVHLGASTITVFDAALLDPRAKRNLANLSRPLKGRRVRLIDGDAECV